MWEKYTPYGFELENEGCWAAYKDSRGNYWVGYNNGYIAVYNPDGVDGITVVEPKAKQNPQKFILSQNYPNPFNPSTTIKYSIPNVETHGHASVQLKVYDVLGREVATLVNEQQSPGNYEVQFDASDLTSGIYFYQLRSGSFIESRKMILLR